MESPSSSDPGQQKAGRPGRLYYLDWLRVLAILMVLLVHVGKIFDYHTTGVYNAVRSPFWSAFREFGLVWVMPLFFVISGAAIHFALKPGETRRFVTSRFTRLVVPLLFVGTFLVNALYVYAERWFHGRAGGFFPWYPEYFEGMYGFGGNFAPLGHGTHLWYLEFLFVYSLLLLPFFIRSKTRIAAGKTPRSAIFEHPLALLLLFLPVSLSGALFEAAGLGFVRGMGGWDPVSYILFLAYGYLLYSNMRILDTVRRHGPLFLAGAVILTLLHVETHFGFNLVIPGVTRHDMAAGGALRPLDHAGWIGVQFFRGLLPWCWILGLLGTGARVLNVNARGLAYANDAVLPFYILHHAVVLLVGVVVVGWSSGIGVKSLVIAAVSFVIIMALYELGIRRFRVMRFLFGMKG